MTSRIDLRSGALTAALFIGLLADLLIGTNGSPGVGISLWALGGTLVLFLLARGRTPPASGESRWLVGGALFFALLFMGRDAEALAGFSFLATIVLLGFAGGRGAHAWARRAFIVEVAAGALRTGILIALGPLGWSIGAARPSPDELPAGRSRSLRLVGMFARGIVMGLPPLFLIGAILMSADPIFDRLLRTAFLDGIEPLLEHLAFAGVIAWFSSGYLRAFLVQDEALMEKVRLPRPALASNEVSIALSLLAILFLTFLAVQVRYLFGGSELVEVTEGLSYAEYARRGFVEMVVASALVVPILLVADWAGAAEGGGRRLLQLVSLLLVLLLAGVLASAGWRLFLYQEAYGLTEDRLYGSVFILWLTGVLVWLSLTVLRGERRGFVFGAAALGVAAILLLQILNPHALIARVNLDRAASGAEYDTDYLVTLSGDAIPVIIGRLDEFPDAELCTVLTALKERWSGAKPGGWRSWNLGEARARSLVADLQVPERCTPQILSSPGTDDAAATGVEVTGEVPETASVGAAAVDAGR